jgi:chloramphenicol 3-O phosphotransferase
MASLGRSSRAPTMMGKLIVLNGGSSSGKTTLAQAFQDLAPECWMHLGIDLFWCAIPPGQLDLERVRPEYYTWDAVIEADGREWFTVHPGPLLDKAMHARYRAIRAYLEDGMNVIADDVIWKREWLLDALRIFEAGKVWLVGIRVSDEEGARREMERGDRHAGWNRGSARAAHADIEYDFELDTTDSSVPALARELHERYQTCRDPKAFDRLRERFLS